MNRQQELLRNMLNSRAFTVAESVARIRGGSIRRSRAIGSGALWSDSP